MRWGRAWFVALTIAVTAASGVAIASPAAAEGSSGQAFAWGYNFRGELGLPAVDRSTSVPTRIDGVPALVDVDSGWQVGLALGESGEVFTTGMNDDWGLGDPTADARRSFAPVPGIPAARSIEMGGQSAAAVDRHGGLWVWGQRIAVYDPVTGVGAVSPGGAAPEFVTGLPTVESVAIGDVHWAALDADGRVWTWGLNDTGVLGHGDTVGRASPTRIESLHDIVAIASGPSTMFAMRGDGSVVAWGDGQDGVLAQPASVASLTPIDIPLARPARRISAGSFHACAALDDGSVWCWGRNRDRQVGATADDVVTTPFQVASSGLDARPLDDIVSVSAGGAHTVALRSDGTVWAWGQGPTAGRSSDDINYPWPAPVPGLTGIGIARAGEYSVFAITRPDVTPPSAGLAPGGLVRTSRLGDAVRGTATDADSGISSVTVVYESLTGETEIQAELSCPPFRRTCDWHAALPASRGIHRVTGTVTDRQGNTASFAGTTMLVV